ncbi:MAG: hypothetical protein M1824_004482 [Vezdaea acicularis]|nr:MAG: hypothetical protein M1824_004482 [Vezdaea acicularis]
MASGTSADALTREDGSHLAENPITNDTPAAITAHEMSNLGIEAREPVTESAAASSPSKEGINSSPGTETIKPSRTNQITDPASFQDPTIAPTHDPLSRQDFTSITAASGPHAAETSDDTGPQVNITFLMVTGSRREWKFDRRSLEKKDVAVPEGNPFKISIYALKQLMVREWPEEWGTKPSAPGAIRLIMLGKLLDDNSTLEGSLSFLLLSHINLFPSLQH